MTTADQVIEAEDYARKQRTGFAPLLRYDITLADGAVETCQKVQAAAFGDGRKFANIMAHPAVNALFAAGALYFEVPRAGAKQGQIPSL